MSARDATKSIEQLLLSLEQLERNGLKVKEDDLSFLKGMLSTEGFKSLLKAHNTVSENSRVSPEPASLSACTLANMISYDAETSPSPQEVELHTLLESPHISALIMAHDRVANKEYPLTVAMDTEESGDPDAKGPTRVVHVKKNKDPLGATVRCNENKEIVVSRVLAGGMAFRSGALHAGDIVHEINDYTVQGWSIDEVATFMQGLTGTVKFKISPALSEYTSRKKNMNLFHIRSLVSYDPKTDHNHPCLEAGLSLERGEMLQVLDHEDPEWWQAIKEGGGAEEGEEEEREVGLIPSKKYMEWILAFSNKGKKRSREKPKEYRPYDSELVGEELPTYEEMVRVMPQQQRPRPIILIAPRNGPFNLVDLQKTILLENPVKFASPVPNTTKPARSAEVGGGHRVVSVSQMERDIMNGEIIEHAVVNGHYYGTSINAIRRVVNSGKTCLLILDPQAIKLVRTSELRPFIVYFTTPTAEFMKKNWVPSKKVKDSAVLDIIRHAIHLERNYMHYFDHYIPYDDLDTAREGVVSLANSLQNNQQWVPSAWSQ